MRAHTSERDHPQAPAYRWRKRYSPAIVAITGDRVACRLLLRQARYFSDFRSSAERDRMVSFGVRSSK